ncbi:MAG: hypothetical protein JWO05_424 [Gemmatimonadetes bacterium]|nr:hypothetical protein [Gemmatimonadota bacterium]
MRGRLIRRAAAALAILLAPAALAAFTTARDDSVIIVSGKVMQAGTGTPVAGASVSAPSRGATAVTDVAGRYRMKVTTARGARVVLLARRIGYAPQSREVTLDRDSISVDFSLAAEAMHLDAVVATGVAEATTMMRAPYALNGKVAGAAIGGQGRERFNTEEYARVEDNAFTSTRSHPLSTFSIDVDRASYSNVRRFVMSEHRLPPKGAVRVEELVNYFPYQYQAPTDGRPVAISADVGQAPWNASHRLVRIALQAPRIPLEKLPPNNLVFLIDVSGSMMPANKLPLLKQSLRLLVNELREQDRVAIVVYAGQAGLVLPSTPASDRERILDALMSLEAGGSTAGGAGIRLAYEVAKQNFIRGGNNRVILATDGDFNVGVSSTGDLERLIEEKRAEGTFLTVLGFGMGNLKDSRMETLADRGNGNYAYIDDLLEAQKTLVRELGGTLVTVAKDVKLQVEFNPAKVRAYRLIGYENRLLKDEDFANDRKDAGEMGAGHSVTALYEILPVGVEKDVEVHEVPALRYQAGTRAGGNPSDELLFVSVRYKLPADSQSVVMRHAVRDSNVRPSGDFGFASAVAGYGMLLRESEFAGSLTYDAVLSMARAGLGADVDGYRAGFVKLVTETARLKSDVARKE